MEPSPDARIRKSADLIVALASTLTTALEERKIEDCGPACQLLSRLCVHAIRQSQAICILVGRMDGATPAYFAEQAGQLLRGLVETWARAAWMMQPETESDRDERALRTVKDSLVEMRKKLEYAISHDLGRADETIEELERQEAIVVEEETKLGREVKLLPDTRCLCETCDRPDLYNIFAHESDPAHASAVTLGTTVSHRDETWQHLGGENRPLRRAALLSATLIVLEATGEVVVDGLDLDSHAWNADKEGVRAETQRLLGPLM